MKLTKSALLNAKNRNRDSRNTETLIKRDGGLTGLKTRKVAGW